MTDLFLGTWSSRASEMDFAIGANSLGFDGYPPPISITFGLCPYFLKMLKASPAAYSIASLY